MSRQRLAWAGVAVVVLVLLAGAAVAGVRWWQESQRSDLELAMAMAPEGSQRLSWTDWAGVRRELGLALSDDASTAEVTELVNRGFEEDLTSTSALVESAVLMHARYGFSPATVDWELFAQSESGATVILGMPDDTDFARIETLLDQLGYTEPDGSGVWKGSPDLLGQIGPVTPEVTFVALDEDERVIITSDTLAAAQQGAQAVDDLTEPGDGLGQVVESLEDGARVLSGAFYTGEQACTALAMSQADAVDQDQAEQLLAGAGRIDPLGGFALTEDAGGDLRVAMAFDDEEEARENANSRARLATGPAPGQGGDFPERFELGQVRAVDNVVTMELDGVEGSYVLSDLSNGPLLFAAC